ncbi:MAG: PKD-like domain-containing protein, partial [Cytophagaceae bacterium]
LCSDAATTIVPANTTYTWAAPAVTGGITGGNTGTAASEISETELFNPTNVAQTATYTVTPTSGDAGFCQGAEFDVVVTVNPTPVLADYSDAICSGTGFDIEPQNGVPAATTIVPANTSYTWATPAVTGGITGGNAGTAVSDISENELFNPTNVAQTATYTVTPTSGVAGFCQGAEFDVVVTVNPTPVLADYSDAICSGTGFDIEPENGVPAATTIVPANTTYTWAAPVVAGGITGGNAGTAAAEISENELFNPTNAAQTATYTVTPTSGDAGACIGADFDVVVTVNPTPVLANYSDAICSGTGFNIEPQNGVPAATTIVPANTNYTWAAPIVTGGITGGNAGAAASEISENELFNPTNVAQTATYTVTPTSGVAGFCQGTEFDVVVTVNPTPVIPSHTEVICSGSEFIADPENGNPAGTIVPGLTTYSWNTPVVTGGITGGYADGGISPVSQELTNPTNIAQTATYTITPTSGVAGQCTGAPFELVVTVNPTPVINNGTETICSATQFNGTPVNGTPTGTIVPTGTTYEWTAPIVTGGLTGANPGAGTSTIAQTLTNPTDMVQTATYIVTPTSGDAGACVGSNFEILVTVNPDAFIALSQPGTDDQELCADVAIETIAYNISGGGTGGNITGLPVGVNGSFNNGIFTISGTPTIAGTYPFTVNTTGTCAQTSASGSIVVNPNATIQLISSAGTDLQTSCAENNITQIRYEIGGGGTGGNVTGLPGNLNGFFGNGIFTISGTPGVAGTYPFTVTTTGTCAQTSASGTITLDAPTVPGSIASLAPICQGDDMPLLVLQNSTGSIIRWESSVAPFNNWQAIANGENNVYPPSSNEPVRYRVLVQNGVCSSVYSNHLDLIVHPIPYAYAGEDTTIFTDQRIQLEATGGVSYSWDYDPMISNTTIHNPWVRPSAEGIYPLVVEVTNEFGCKDLTEITLTVVDRRPFFIPNTFTPNGDGVNDFWILENIEDYPNAEMEIYNRWGILLIKRENNINNWDGIVNGRLLPVGTYFYILNVNVDGIDPVAGSITIIK